MTVKKEGYAEINLSLDQIMPIVERAIVMAEFTITHKYASVITASKGVSFKTWGSNITVAVTPLEPSKCRVVMTSETALPTVLVDWGEQEGNCRKFFQIFHHLVGQFIQQQQMKIS